MAKNSGRDRGHIDRSRAAGRQRASSSKGFRLSHNQVETVESEESQREKEHKDVKVNFSPTLQYFKYLCLIF